MGNRVSIEDAKKIIADGGVLIMPTDTAYGITCDANNSGAVERIFEIKGREADKSFTIHIGELNMVTQWVENLSDIARQLIAEFWSGDLNIVFNTYRWVDYITRKTGDINTVAIRMPDHNVPIELSKYLGNAIVGTSANFSGGQTAFKFEELNSEFIRLADGIIEGECGCKPASTVVGFDENGEVKVFREGAITKEMIEKVL